MARACIASFAALALALVATARADEGMWTFDNPPFAHMNERYGFVPDANWLEHAQTASLRFNSGGSGAFVSPSGLVLTNHHVALGQLQKLSTPDRDLVKDGFQARSAGEELPCPDLELNQLLSFENITKHVLAAVEKAASAQDADDQRKAAIARLTKSCNERTGLRCDVVKLYQGGEYWLYRYRKYTDVRLVMAPELSAAFFGGELDNFTYPRFALDYAFFRVYDEGAPARPKHWFGWSEGGAKEGELTFVTGHPGHTQRLLTVAQLAFERDVAIPPGLEAADRRLATLHTYSERGEEEARRAQSLIFGVENYRKAMTGMLQGLRDPEVFEQKRQEEETLRASDAAAGLVPWERIDSARQKLAPLHRRYSLVTSAGQRGHSLWRQAETIVRYVVEVERPNEERYAEYRDSNLESLQFDLFSTAPVYPDLDEALLAARLEEYREELGADDPFVVDLLAGREPNVAAAETFAATMVGDPEFRKQLVRGGSTAVAASTDPLIAMARRADAHYRVQRDWYEDEIESVETLAAEEIARIRFAAFGKSTYPDATFTLRLSYGRPASYELGTTRVPYKTVFGGLYARSDSFDGEPPFDLSPRIAAARKRVNPSAPLDFVSNHDITGGNSGSPVVNTKLEIVGLIFDGNIQGLVTDYAYSDVRARAVSVHSDAILESLRSVYDMAPLARELVREE